MWLGRQSFLRGVRWLGWCWERKVARIIRMAGVRSIAKMARYTRVDSVARLARVA